MQTQTVTKLAHFFGYKHKWISLFFF